MAPFRFLCVAWLAGTLAPTVPFTLTGRAADAIPAAPARPAVSAATAGNTAALATSFESQIRPLLKEYCLGCHSTEKHKGDPGPIVLHRLNNSEYTYTIPDLTGVASLDPAKEFPADSAAGEGFMRPMVVDG